ncbi:hypothetical protein AAVH_02661 [Aphelenchoides avenae]|nr:hypothetical protein AAVH_02661 [Aphelenchus avenae]
MDQLNGVWCTIYDISKQAINTIKPKVAPGSVVVTPAPAPSKFCIAPMNPAGTAFIRIAGLSGAAAIAFAAYGAHALRDSSAVQNGDGIHMDEKRKRAFENGNKQHIIHSLALLMSPKARFPVLTGALFSLGILLFVGPCYHYGIWNNERFRRVTPLGGICFILGWLSFVL